MRPIPPSPLGPFHPDLTVIRQIEAALVRQAKGEERLREDLPLLIRQAIDEVIDAPRTGRVHARELEKTEKTYIGTKVEILVRNYFRLPKGILDLRIDGHDVDVKNTLGSNWMIPREAVGKACILVASDEDRRACYFGIIVARQEYLTVGVNQDQKRSITAAGQMNIHWLLYGQSYPPSFWSQLGAAKTHAIMRGKNGTERVAALFREAVGVVIHRDIVQAVAQQKDYMKRLRKNGGARDKLAQEAIGILSGTYDKGVIQQLGLPSITADEFVSVLADTPQKRAILVGAGEL